MFLQRRNKLIYMGMLFLTILCTFAYGINKIYGFSFYPDEFGYWASAAGILGYDWSDLTKNMLYYSFGYSIILAPIYWFSKNGVVAYRVAVAINMILMCFSGFLLYRIMQFLYPEEKEQPQWIAVGVALCYPGWILYMQTTMVEILLVFVYLLCCYFLLNFLKNNHSVHAILFGVTLSALFWVHMRSVGVVISGVLVMIAYMIKGSKKRLTSMVSIAVLITVMIAGYEFKDYIVSHIYSQTSEKLLSVNDFSGQTHKLRSLLTWSSFQDLILEMTAKVFYLIMSTFGIIYWGFRHIFNELKQALRSKHIELNSYLKLFFLLSMLAQFAICAIAMHGGTRIDTIVYGRYMEFVLPPIMLMGVYEMRKNKCFKESLIFIGIAALGLLSILYFIQNRDLSGVVAPFMLGISYLLNEYNLSHFQSNQVTFFLQAYLFGSMIIAIIVFINYLSKKVINGTYILVLIILLEVSGGILLSEKYTYDYNAGLKMDLDLYQESLSQNGTDPKVYYLHEGNTLAILVLQLFDKDITIHTVTMDELEKVANEEGSILIADYTSESRNKLQEYFDHEGFSTSFLMYY